MRLSKPGGRIGPLAGFVILPAALLASACATLPESADLRSPLTAGSLATAQSLPLTEVEWPTDGWWKSFGDPQLTKLIEEGLSGAADLRVAEARFARADALTGQARSRLTPTLDAAAQGGGMQQSDNYLFPSGFAPRNWPDYGQATLSLNWDLDFWGRNRAALAAARSDRDAALAETAAARLAVSAGVAGAYAELADLHAQRDAAQNASKVRAQTLELMQGRQAQGLENSGAVARAQSGLASAHGDLAALDEAIALTQNRISALIGAGPDRAKIITRPALAGQAPPPGLPRNLQAELIGRRPDIRAALMRVEASASRIKQSRAAFYPNINLTGLIGLQALGIDNVFKSGSDFGSVGPAISLPIFDGGRLRGQYRAAEAEYQIAVAQYDDTLMEALRQIADAVTSERALTTRLDRAREAEQAANAAWTVANNRYRGGLATYLDVLAAEDALIATRRTLASLQARAFALDVDLIRALGGGFRS